MGKGLYQGGPTCASALLVSHILDAGGSGGAPLGAEAFSLADIEKSFTGMLGDMGKAVGISGGGGGAGGGGGGGDGGGGGGGGGG